MPTLANLKVLLYPLGLQLGWIGTIQSIRAGVSCWVVPCLEREKLRQSIVILWSVGIKWLEDAWKMLFADCYYSLAIDLKMKQYWTFWRGLLQDLRAGCRTEA